MSMADSCHILTWSSIFHRQHSLVDQLSSNLACKHITTLPCCTHINLIWVSKWAALTSISTYNGTFQRRVLAEHQHHWYWHQTRNNKKQAVQEFWAQATSHGVPSLTMKGSLLLYAVTNDSMIPFAVYNAFQGAGQPNGMISTPSNNGSLGSS